jgi:hypothetical protein
MGLKKTMKNAMKSRPQRRKSDLASAEYEAELQATRLGHMTERPIISSMGN